jgi:hypothetical protein
LFAVLPFSGGYCQAKDQRLPFAVSALHSRCTIIGGSFVEHTGVPLLIGEDRLEQTRFPCDAESLLERPCERTSPSKILRRVRLNQINASMSATLINDVASLEPVTRNR